jgi:prepilin-type N-terminal cleavage/methylation domain-containing protein
MIHSIPLTDCRYANGGKTRESEAPAELSTQRFGRSLTHPSNESSCQRSRRRFSSRRGFTLLELILSLALCAVVAGLIGSLVHIYLLNQETGRDSVQQSQMARAVLNMIAEDVRTSVRYQSFDTGGLQELLSGATGGGSMSGGATTGGTAGGSTSGGSSSGVGGTTGAATSGSTGGASTGGASSSGSGATDTGSTSTTTNAPLPPGIYGSSTSIEIDVSRLPRPDEYYPKVGDTSLGTLGDMPSDVKTVGYYVQSPRSDGVQDS